MSGSSERARSSVGQSEKEKEKEKEKKKKTISKEIAAKFRALPPVQPRAAALQHKAAASAFTRLSVCLASLNWLQSLPACSCAHFTLKPSDGQAWHTLTLSRSVSHSHTSQLHSLSRARLFSPRSLGAALSFGPFSAAQLQPTHFAPVCKWRSVLLCGCFAIPATLSDSLWLVWTLCLPCSPSTPVPSPSSATILHHFGISAPIATTRLRSPATYQARCSRVRSALLPASNHCSTVDERASFHHRRPRGHPLPGSILDFD